MMMINSDGSINNGYSIKLEDAIAMDLHQATMN